MKIGVVSKFLPEKDGIAIYTENLLNNFKGSIIKIGNFSSKTDYRIKFDNFDFYEKINPIIKKEKIDLIHFQYIAAWYGKYALNYPFIRALKAIKIPKVVTLHEVQYDNKGIKNKILEIIEKKIVKYADKIIVHTPRQAEFINKKYKTDKAECIYMGVNIKENDPKKGKNILFFGMISEGKGVIDLIKAKKYLLDYKIKIAGRPVTKSYENKIISAAKEGDIELKLGWISEEGKDKLYRWANIIVLPYRWAPYQSAVLHDALSYGLSVVVTKVGAIWEIVNRFKCGVVAKKGDSQDIANSIKFCFENYNKYTLGVRKYQNIAKLKNSVVKHRELYNKLL